MIRPIRRIRNAWRRHGALGCLRLTARNIRHYLSLLINLRPRETAPDPFDQALGTDTAAIREAGSLDVASANFRYAEGYQPSDSELVKQTIEGLAIDPSGFSFIDFGSGKGRVVLLAACYPFKAVIGIEFSRELHEIALSNISRVPQRMKTASEISLLCCDAMEFEVPMSDLVCYFYNPFGPAVLAPIAQRLARHRAKGYRVIVIYLNPEHRHVFETAGGFRVERDAPPLLVLAA